MSVPSQSQPRAERAAVVLAAGKGTRFRSEVAKVLHRASGRTMLAWVLEALRPLGLDTVVVVVGHQAAEVTAEAEAAQLGGLVTVQQTEQRGTGHAMRTALASGALDAVDRLLVVPGDTPLLSTANLTPLLDAREAAVLLTTELDDPTGYGRIIRGADGTVQRIVEERDATPAERAVREVNTSVYAFARTPLARALDGLTTDNAQGEEYLTDVVAPLVQEGVAAVTAPAGDVVGVNDRVALAAVDAVLRRRILDALMRAGVAVVDPATTYVEAEVDVAADATLLPGTHLEGRTRIATGATVGPNSRLVDTEIAEGASVTYSVLLGASVGPHATVGPFTYLRPGTRLEARAKAGAFVEMKASVVGEGSKVPHLSYVGDTTIGRDANIGAATITLNYDGYDKHRTEIGDRAKVGGDTMLVAPVRVGDDAYTGAGSVITSDVPDGALALERSEQRVIEGYAARRRARAERDRTDG